MAQNIKHIDHVIWICHPENQAQYVEKLAKLSEAKFHGPLERGDLGVRIYISWSSGLEIIAPLEKATIYSQSLKDHLAKRGEGLLGVVFGVSNIEEARKRAMMLGYEVSPLIQNAGDEPYVDETEVMKEIMVGDFMNSLFVFGEIKYAKGVTQIIGD
jgi:hypothetical protein